MKLPYSLTIGGRVLYTGSSREHQGVTMVELSRRKVVALSAGGLSALCLPSAVVAATQCVTGGLPGFLPNSLTVDCASARNFRTFRQYSDYVGLAGVVSMSYVKGKYAAFQAGNLSIFPWIKPKGQGKTFPALMPTSATQAANSSPIPNTLLPLDEYYLRYIIQAPWTSYIGFLVDVPYTGDDSRRDWFSNVDKLADGAGIGIDWTSHNLNGPWFAGSNWIPNTDDCNGNAWRNVIVAGLQQASAAAC